MALQAGTYLGYGLCILPVKGEGMFHELGAQHEKLDCRAIFYRIELFASGPRRRQKEGP